MLIDMICFAALCLLPPALGYGTLIVCRRLRRRDYAFSPGKHNPLQSTLTFRRPSR